jgi:NADH pyrophosphatase NudC (nudix superfamily)
MSLQRTFTFCPSCGRNRFQSGSFKPWRCPDCGLEFFQNSATAAGALIFDERGRLLTIRRAKEPAKGKLGVPGGFLDAGETAEAGLQRETMEEVGLLLSDICYLGSFPNKYDYKGITYDTLDLFFTAQIAGSAAMKLSDEVTSVEWHDPMSFDLAELAFPSMVRAVERYRQNRSM